MGTHLKILTVALPVSGEQMFVAHSAVKRREATSPGARDYIPEPWRVGCKHLHCNRKFPPSNPRLRRRLATSCPFAVEIRCLGKVLTWRNWAIQSRSQLAGELAH